MALPIPINDPTSGVRLATRAYPELQGNDLDELPSDAAFEQVIPGDTNTANVVSLVQLVDRKFAKHDFPTLCRVIRAA